VPKFKLTPALDRLSDPLWQRSQPPHEACYVVAANEQKAREAAARHFEMIYLATGNNPWQLPEFTECIEVADFDGNMPTGLIYRESEITRHPQTGR